MKAVILIFSFLFATLQALPQDIKFEKPNYKKIKKAISKRKSDLYYPKLMEKYLKGDTTMTLEEKRHLYYGFTFQSNYSPYGEPDYYDSLLAVLKQDTLTNDDLHKIIVFADSVLAEDPFNLRSMDYQLYAYKQLGKEEAYMKRFAQMQIIVDAILSTGIGISKETAFYVIAVPHEYFILEVLGFEFGNLQKLIDHYDFLKVADNEYGIEGLYFDVTPCLNSLNKIFGK